MLFGKLHCVCVKAKEHDQDTVTSTLSLFSYEYNRKRMRINIFCNFNENYQTIISIFKYKSQIYILHNYYCSYSFPNTVYSYEFETKVLIKKIHY